MFHARSKQISFSKLYFIIIYNKKKILKVGVGRAIVQPIIEPSNRRLSNKNCHSTANSTTPTATEEQVVVAFYRPAGNNNRAGQFALNVSKPIKNNINT